MSTRLKRLAADWKTYVALVSGACAVLTAFAGVFEATKKTSTALRDVPLEARWVVAGVLVLVALTVLVLSLGRKSVLLRPDRFILSADDPQYLIGRDEEIKELASRCERHPLVFLQGESGAGKSALVQAGLLPFYLHPNDPTLQRRRLLPMRIDASSLAWGDGLRVELARALAGLTQTERSDLGAANAVDSQDPFDWISNLPRHAQRQILLVLDQIDDYAVANREEFVAGRTVVSPDVIARSPDWGSIARLLRNGLIRLLLVCRSDSSGILDALRFTSGTTFLLPRIEQQLIKPIIEKITSDDGKGHVIEDAEFGWEQLRERLMGDLAATGGSVLPVQLAVAFDSLRRFRFLTPVEYRRCGGLRGLERLHIERLVRDAARAANVSERTLLTALIGFVTDDGLKTRRVPLRTFQERVGSHLGSRDVAALVDHLVHGRILRLQTSTDGTYLLLHHDYLARGLREAYRQTNRWEELLRERSREFQEAFGWRQRWRALLPVAVQAQLIAGRLRQRFHYASHRRFAVWSLARLVPPVILLTCIGAAGSWFDRINQHNLGERMLWSVQEDRAISDPEASEWVSLAGARDIARFHAAGIALSRASMADKIRSRAEILAHAVVGLDPSGSLSRQLAQIAQSSLRRNNASFPAVVALLPYMRLTSEEANSLSNSVLSHIAPNTDIPVLAGVARDLSAANASIPPEHVRSLVSALVTQVISEQDVEDIHRWIQPLRTLAPLVGSDFTLDPEPLIERLSSEESEKGLADLRQVYHLVRPLFGDLPLQTSARRLVDEIVNEPDSWKLVQLGHAFSVVGDELVLHPRLEPTAAIVKRMASDQDRDNLKALGHALTVVSAGCGIDELGESVIALRSRIDSEQDPYSLAELCKAVAVLDPKLESEVAHHAAAALIEKCKPTESDEALLQLADSLGRFGRIVGRDDLRVAVSTLFSRVVDSPLDYDAVELEKTIAAFDNLVEQDVLATAALKLIDAISHKSASEDRLLERGQSLTHLLMRVNPSVLQSAADAILNRIRSGGSNLQVAVLGQILARFKAGVSDEDLRFVAADLTTRMAVEGDIDVLIGLAKARAGFALQSDANQLRPLMRRLTDRMRAARNSDELATIASAFVQVEVCAGAGFSTRERLEQYVSLLKLPLAVGDCRRTLLDGIDVLSGQSFKGDIRRFTEWATSSNEGRRYKMDLRSRRGR